jgi:hypothetical protein
MLSKRPEHSRLQGCVPTHLLLCAVHAMANLIAGHTCNRESATMERIPTMPFLIQRSVEAGDVMLMWMLLLRRDDLLPDLSAIRMAHPFPKGGTRTSKRSRSVTCTHKGLAHVSYVGVPRLEPTSTCILRAHDLQAPPRHAALWWPALTNSNQNSGMQR